MSGKGTVELLNFQTTNPEELQSIISQKFTLIEQVEPMGKEFLADYRAYAVGQVMQPHTDPTGTDVGFCTS